jgi:hypothetical protein
MSDIITGVYQMFEQQYHSDPCPEPSLSSSIAGIIWHRTPWHGWMAHPKLNPAYEHKDSGAFDLGTAAHAVLLEGNESKICVIDADDWRTKAAKEQRDEARASGLIPMLPPQYREVMQMAESARVAIEESEIAGILEDGKPEQTLIAEYEGIWLRGRLDWLTTNRKTILDYKTVGRSANPESFLRSSVFNYGYDIQAAFYRLLNRLTGGPEDARYLWLVQEIEAPYAASICGASPSLIECGERKLFSVISKWQECMMTGEWPGYSKRIAWLEAPAWELGKVEEREILDMEGEE